MKKILLTLLILLAALSPVSAEDFQTKKFVLDNQLVVLINEMPSSTVISIDALVKTGSATEGKYLGSGISHFLEHMLFKGTKNRAVGEIAREVQSLGGVINASTSFDYTMYTLELPQGNFDKALDIVSDMLMHSSFDPIEIEKEREVIFGEMRLYYDNPARKLSELVYGNVFIRHPYRHPIIGYEPLFRAITREDLLDYYRIHYVPNNIVLAIAGPVDAEEILPSIKDAFRNFAMRSHQGRDLPVEPPQISQRRYEEEYATDLTRMSMAYQGVSVLDRDMFALDVLSLILGQGESSRLYREIFKKQGLVQAISSSNFTPMDKGIFEVEAILDQENVEKTIAAVQLQIEQIQQKGVSTGELEKAKRLVLRNYVFDHQTSSDLSVNAAFNEAFIGDPEFSKKYVEAIKKVDVEDIKRVARRYLIDSNLTIVVLKPMNTVALQRDERAEEDAAKIEKVILDNGLTVLLRADRRFPLVSLRLALNGGTRLEEERLNGTFNLLSRVWTQGTKSRSAQEIAQTTESLGIALSGFSGRSSFGLNLECLSQDIDFALKLLEDLAKNPTFPQDELEKEKIKVRADIRAQQDQISAVTSQALRETLFLKHSLRLHPLGTLESVDRINRADILEAYRRLFVPSNMVVSVFGDFDREKILKEIRNRFSQLKGERVELVPEVEAPPVDPREKTLHLDKQQAMLMLGFQGPGLKDDDRYGVEVLSSILGSSLSGRMFTKIRDEMGKAYTLGSGFTPTMDMGLIYFYVLTTDADAEKVRELLLKQIRELQDTDLAESELKNTKEYLKGTHAMGLETNSSLGFISTLNELYGLGFDEHLAYDERIDAVTESDIKRLAAKYLDPRKSVFILSRPKKANAEPGGTTP